MSGHVRCEEQRGCPLVVFAVSIKRRGCGVWIQEEQTVTFQPMFVDGKPYWMEKLFVLYLLFILLLLLNRIVRLLFSLRVLRKLNRSEQADVPVWSEVWTESWLYAHSLTKFGILTFFMSVLTLSMSIVDEFMGLATEKHYVAPFVLERLAYKLTAFNAGMVVSIALYAAGFFFESRLHRRKLAFERVWNKPASPVDSPPGDMRV